MTGERTLNNVFLACRKQLAWVASRIVPPHAIEDIVQETYVRACQFEIKDEIHTPRALMVKIARNLSLDHVKRAESKLTSSYEQELEEGYGDSDEDIPFRQVASDEEFARFCEAVRQLPPQCRKVFVLKKVYGHTQREIAASLKLSENTVEKHIAKGMKLCMRYLLERSNEEPSDQVISARQGGKA